MIEPQNPVLAKMLDRLFASMVNGPSMNCRPHASRQRVDLAQLSRLADIDAGSVLLALLGDDHEAKVVARVPQPAKPAAKRVSGGDAEQDDQEEPELSPQERAARQAWSDQQSLLTKVRLIADDARTYEQDTGAHALNIGFPLLNLPPGTFGGRGGIASRRVLAPIAFIPVTVTVKCGTRPSVEVACRSEGVDLVVPNIALLAWLEQQTGQPFPNPFDDEKGEKPWQEIAELVKAVATRTEIRPPEFFSAAEPPEALAITATPKADQDGTGPSIVNAAVLGLFPVANQGLLADTRAMLTDGVAEGPIESFVRHGVSLEVAPQVEANAEVPIATPPPAARNFAGERLVTHADPCQARAVRLARQCKGLVIHGPPGTGKSQTITNVIGDHLARGERVLFVCDKRTALDVVADRLRALGLADLCATVHDPQRDQREFYRSVREQLDNLADTTVKENVANKLAKVDEELQELHQELTAYRTALMGKNGGPGSFHHLVGQWLGELGEAAPNVDLKPLESLSLAEFEQHQVRAREMLERGEAVDYARNPWRTAAGIPLAQFLAQLMDVYRGLMARFVAAAEEADATLDPLHPPFELQSDIKVEATRRENIASRLPELLAAVEAAKHAAAQPFEAIAAARRQLSEASHWLEEIRARRLDTTLKIPEPPPPADQLAADAAFLQRYAAAFDSRAMLFARLRAAAPDADEAVALKWLTADAKAAAAAKKRLDGAAALADAVDDGSLDASLLSRYEASPLPAAKLIEALAALSAYLDIASTWHAFFHFGAKKAAEPFVRQFGLSLSAASARQVHQFLADLQKRLDLQAAVEAAKGQPFGRRAEDAELVEAFVHHRSVVSAVAGGDAGPRAAVNSSVSPATIAAIIQLLGKDAEQAATLLQRHALSATGAEAARVAAFYVGAEARRRVGHLLARGRIITSEVPLAGDTELLNGAVLLGRLLDLLQEVGRGNPLGDAVLRAMSDPPTADSFVTALQRSPIRARAILEALEAQEQAKLFSTTFAASYRKRLFQGASVADGARDLSARLHTLEGVIRIGEGLKLLPPVLTAALSKLLETSPHADSAFSAVRRHALAGEIARRLQADPQLQAADDHRLRTAFNRFRKLAENKKSLVVDLIREQWVTKQKDRLLAGTQSRLNSAGADLRRRLTTRGERAMRLRQVLAHGAETEGGDPLMDLRPVWMASPETVAELFSREPIFDVVVFDEASQCRLEEALPVLTRAKRVVIAGDPRQLPPSRFFESAVVSSDDVDAETDQEWFELHQGEVEDLLTAALGLDVQQSYLDVHYRSRNADLIEFSNEHFYGSRLQAIPGHPSNRSRFAPITLYRVQGVYEKRRNVAEAEQVCIIVRDLLKRSSPPSIGIACFNLVQRDLIVEKLEEMAEQDATFARRLEEARERRGPSSSEGLFVKNLENVQGDERDHLIISTTYGPDAAGKFRRSFGPLGTAGGGRRLNVLVTRARNELHLVTSIPRSIYTSLPEVPQGTTPSGGWLLFAYLAYAERLAAEYELNHRVLENAEPSQPATVNVRPTRTPSEFAKALATRIANARRFGSDVHWGNEGFGIDVVMQHPHRAEDVTVGVLCDMTRFAGSDDPVEWEVFRTAIHESQGWKLQRVWTPHFFRDPAGTIQGIIGEIEQMLMAERKQRAAEKT